MTDIFLATLPSYLMQLPIYLVWGVGFALALIYWRKHPRVSLLVVIAVSIMFLHSLIGTYVNMWLPMTLSGRGMSLSQISVFFTVSGIISTLISAVSWGLIIAAIFGWRQEQAKPTVSSSD